MFKRYQSYKKFLQHEFERVCVYCRQPDTAAPNLAYSVDHFRPKGRPAFAHLVNDYSNLYYCCPPCNSRKRDYWPGSLSEPRVVNPCDEVMTDHLRFDAGSGAFTSHSQHGDHMLELLQLNDEDVVKFRRAAMANARLLQRRLDEAEIEMRQLHRDLTLGRISEADHTRDIGELAADMADLAEAMKLVTGKKKLPSLPRRGLLSAA